MLKVKLAMLTVISAAALAGCAGTRFSFDDARRVQPGMSVTELQAIMGRPYRVTSREDGEIWVWSHVNGMTGSSQVVSFTVVDGKVVKVPKIPESF